MEKARVLDILRGYPVFGLDEMWKAINSFDEKYSLNTARAGLQQFLRAGLISRVGRNQYTVSDQKMPVYNHMYSKLTEDVAGLVSQDYPYLEFSVFELVQLNRFVNHQIAHNVVFLGVEKGLGDYVFGKLKGEYPGHVLMNPTITVYDQYWTDDLIIIHRLLTEAPKGADVPWHTCLEKLLVDLLAEPLYQEIINRGEYPVIFEDAFHNYAIDESRMFRYARRRNAANKLKAFIRDETDIELRTVK